MIANTYQPQIVFLCMSSNLSRVARSYMHRDLLHIFRTISIRIVRWVCAIHNQLTWQHLAKIASVLPRSSTDSGGAKNLLGDQLDFVLDLPFSV